MCDTRHRGGVQMWKDKTSTQDQVRHVDMEISLPEHLSITLLRLWQCHPSCEGGQTCLPLLEHPSINQSINHAAAPPACMQEKEV
mmetsp:Transcript_46052/g.67573  ORF Transcript_46052/g.67573 Transcript_46052/m.67573 type:complete len:85 (-) Transcript_46052:624-878(-)